MVIDSLKDFPSTQPQLIRYSLFLILVSAAEGVFRFYMRRLLIGVSRKIEYSIRNDFFAHLQKLDSTFFENNRTGSIMALMSNDLDAVRNFLGPGLLNLFNTVIVFISTLIIMFLISPRLTLYSLIAIPLLPVIVSRLSAMLHRRFKLSQEHYALLSARTQESIAGIKVIKSFTQEKNETDSFSDLNKEYIYKNMELARVRSIFWPVMILVGGIGSLLVLLVGGQQVIEGRLTLGQFVQFSAYIITLTWPLISLGWVINLIQRGEVSMGRLNKIFDMSATISETQNPQNISKLKGNILFEDVHFSYPVVKNYELYGEEQEEHRIRSYVKKLQSSFLGTFLKQNDKNNKILADAENGEETGYQNISGNGSHGSGIANGAGKLPENKVPKGDERWVLKKINFEILSGTQTGIVGFTGSGKSTVVNLIPRLYDPQKGSISIDGINIKKIPLSVLRSDIAYVTQDPFIFSKTIKENILFGKEELLENSFQNNIYNTEQQVTNASKISHLHEDILTFPEGYNTMIGERGITLSGGQKQRLAIARALMADPEILILDDSFSNIDTATEELILTDLKARIKSLTTIIISHRISTIKDSDLIIVIDEGEISETGTHKELLKKCGIYRKLYYRQQLSEELEEEL